MKSVLFLARIKWTDINLFQFSYDANNYPTSYQAPQTAPSADTTTSYVHDIDGSIRPVTSILSFWP